MTTSCIRRGLCDGIMAKSSLLSRDPKRSVCGQEHKWLAGASYLGGPMCGPGGCIAPAISKLPSGPCGKEVEDGFLYIFLYIISAPNPNRLGKKSLTSE